MIKFTSTKDGRTLLGLGLSFKNLDHFRAHPLDTYIHVDGKALGLPIDVILFSGETEAGLADHMQDLIGPNTKIHIDPKVKS